LSTLFAETEVSVVTDPASSIWLRPERAARGPAPEFSRAALARAAIEIADVRGLQAATMRQVATALGTAPASLYRYVATRSELVELMIDQVVGAVPYEPLSGDWRADLVTLARQSRTMLMSHPWMIEAQGSGRQVGPGVAAYLEHGLAALHQVRRPGWEKLEALAILSGVVRLLAGAELAETTGAAVDARTQATAGAYLAHIVARGGHPHLAAALGDARTSDDDLFDRVVVRVLNGLIADDLSTATPEGASVSVADGTVGG
jgi:AcrR family transcriptional regulator